MGVVLAALLACIALTIPAIAQSPQDYGFYYWQNGFRAATDPNRGILCLETGNWALVMDTLKMKPLHFGPLSDGLTYDQAVTKMSDERLAKLPPADLDISIEVDGKTYRPDGNLATQTKNLAYNRMWETGRYMQRADIQGITFSDKAGAKLRGRANLEFIAWPESLTMRLVARPMDIIGKGPCPGVVGNGECFTGNYADRKPSIKGRLKQLTLETWVYLPEAITNPDGGGWFICVNANEWVDGSFGFMGNTKSPMALIDVGGGRDNSFSSPANMVLSFDKWHQLALTWDNKKLHYYIDGKIVSEKDAPGESVPAPTSLRIAGRGDTPEKSFITKAAFDEISIWSRALSADEIAARFKDPAKALPGEGPAWREAFDGTGGKKIPVVKTEWKNPKIRLALKDARAVFASAESSATTVTWLPGEDHAVSAVWRLKSAVPSNILIEAAQIGDTENYPAAWSADWQCFKIDVASIKRDWPSGYGECNGYDRIRVKLTNPSDKPAIVPVLVAMTCPANITGLTPVLCAPDGRPTGIAVQNSKNWHYHSGPYTNSAMMIPMAPGEKAEYEFRMVYGFWGGVPEASYGQLCLVGYGGNQRWDQLSMGCWGETFCQDIDTCLPPNVICDVRSLQLKKPGDPKWGWTENSGGGDWLFLTGSDDKRIPLGECKSAYLSQGPNLARVRYTADYGKAVRLKAEVRNLRNADYSRVLHQFDYECLENIAFKRCSFMELGSETYACCPTYSVAVGDRNGLLAEFKVPEKAKPGELIAKEFQCTGSGPWWVAFDDEKNPITGARNLIIRQFNGKFGDRQTTAPTLAFRVMKGTWEQGSKVYVNAEIVPPVGVAELKKGDTASMDYAWMLSPANAADYYGADTGLIEFLKARKAYWETALREAAGNDLEVKAAKGKVVTRYPLEMRADDRGQAAFSFTGGVGLIPVTISGLKTLPAAPQLVQIMADGTRKPLDQSVKGNDFWQVERESNNEYRLTWNVPPSENGKASMWELAGK